ncbi:MAG TPA: copper chaperone PCu(A)C [Anaerolineales bacterium]|nr:copper chaperone PCu(A)C [Anaerolineales bacterium]
MKRVLIFAFAMLLLLSACSAEQGIEVQGAWARPTAQGENGAIYFVIQNNTRETDELTGVSSDVAEAVEMHESKTEGDVMQMHPLETVPLQAGAKTTFKPGGLHIMLIGVKQDLKIGEEIEITLHFKNAGDIKIPVLVREPPELDDD